MLIISSYRDYYDSMAYAYGIDKSLVFHREPSHESLNLKKLTIFQQELLSKLQYASIKNTRNNFYLSPNILFIADKMYLYIEYSYCGKTTHIYDIDDPLLDCVGMYGRKVLNQLLDSLNNLKSIFQLVNKPYFMIGINSFPHSYNITIPKLSDIEFHKILDANECYQLVESALYKIKGNHDDKLVSISDKDRLTQHGFDDKISFRHRM